MITKDEFLRIVLSNQNLPEDLRTQIDDQFDSASEAAGILQKSMPGIGFLSVQKRLNAFFSVCRHVDELVRYSQISADEGQLSILILRLADESFKKAAIMFDLRADRFDIDARAEMPRSARQYLANLKLRR